LQASDLGLAVAPEDEVRPVGRKYRGQLRDGSLDGLVLLGRERPLVEVRLGPFGEFLDGLIMIRLTVYR
jgi:hypothetical protein